MAREIAYVTITVNAADITYVYFNGGQHCCYLVDLLAFGMPFDVKTGLDLLPEDLSDARKSLTGRTLCFRMEMDRGNRNVYFKNYGSWTIPVEIFPTMLAVPVGVVP